MSHLLPSRGRAGLVLSMTIERELTPDDFIAAALRPAEKGAGPILNRIRAAHHQAPRLVAEGRPDVEVAYLTDYTAQRIRDLKVDPAFAELVAYYHDQI